MRKYLLHSLGGLLAVAVLAVIPAAAQAAPIAAASADPSCYDDNEPYSGWGNGGWWQDGHRPYWRGWGDGDGYFGGHSYDPGCDAAHPGKVDRVMVAVQRMRGDKCNNMSRGGRLGPGGDCSDIAWFRAKGTSHWRHRINRRLPSGHYRLHRRAIDANGNREAPKHRHLWIR
jgi:hypothetical protein